MPKRRRTGVEEKRKERLETDRRGGQEAERIYDLK